MHLLWFARQGGFGEGVVGVLALDFALCACCSDVTLAFVPQFNSSLSLYLLVVLLQTLGGGASQQWWVDAHRERGNARLPAFATSLQLQPNQVSFGRNEFEATKADQTLTGPTEASRTPPKPAHSPHALKVSFALVMRV